MLRKAALAGIWYPKEIDRLDELVITEGEGNLVGAVLPHSGLMFSSPLISSFFTRLSPGIEKILIISPSHYFRLPGEFLYSSSFTESETPYGNIITLPIETGRISDEAAQREHGIEMFLPFIKKKNLSVSYLVTGRGSDVAGMSEIILRLTDERTGLIASSDFTHYGPSYGYTPYGHNGFSSAMEDDERCAALLADGRAAEAFGEFKNTTVCGIYPASIVSEVFRSLGMKGFTGNHYTSGDILGSYDDFVDYRTVFWGR